MAKLLKQVTLGAPGKPEKRDQEKAGGAPG
jgi:hypothetical protein